jgi:hypothetical protein
MVHVTYIALVKLVCFSSSPTKLKTKGCKRSSWLTFRLGRFRSCSDWIDVLRLSVVSWYAIKVTGQLPRLHVGFPLFNSSDPLVCQSCDADMSREARANFTREAIHRWCQRLAKPESPMT